MMKYKNTNRYPIYAECGNSCIKLSPGEVIETSNSIHFPGVELILEQVPVEKVYKKRKTVKENDDKRKD